MSEEKLLAIVIPTYNRAALLHKALSCLLPQTSNYSALVDVYVSDNHSPDETESVVRLFMKDYPNLKYHKQPENIGGNNNFFDAATRVRTKFVALLGDDDFVLPYYVKTIIEFLDKYPNVGLINVNVLSVTENGIYMGTRDQLAVDNHIKIYHTAGEFLKKHLISPSLISSNVFLRSPFIEIMNTIKKEDYPGYDWYYAMIRSVINKPCIYYDIPLLTQRQPLGENVRWLKEAPIYFIYGFGHMFESLDKLSPGMKAAWNDFFQKDSTPPYLLDVISNNRDYYADKFSLLAKYISNRKYVYQMYLYIHYPQKVAKITIKALKIIYRLIKQFK